MDGNVVFGSSVTRAPDGRLLVLCHATSDSFDEFDTSRGELGIHFGSRAQMDDLDEKWGLQNLYDEDGVPVGARIFPCVLDVKNPLRMVDEGEFTPKRLHDVLLRMGVVDASDIAFLADGVSWRDKVRRSQMLLGRLGYDGIVYLNRHEGVLGSVIQEDADVDDVEFAARHPEAEDSWIVFAASQIRFLLAEPLP